jgi:flavin reductase (DIM6/NTAB) family NADH-FMN oxidoreductase RutF
VPKQSATRTFTIIVTPMTIVTTSLPDGRKGAWYSTQLVASGGKPTLAWSVAGGVLPTGLKLSSAGRITGYPKATGTWTFTVKVVDASVPRNDALRTLSVTIV